MTAATLLLLALLAAVAVPAWWRRVLPREVLRDGWSLGLLLLLAAAAVSAFAAGENAGDWVRATLVVLAGAAAVAGGGPVTETVLRRASRGPTPAIDTEGGPQVLRGGAWIGALERLAVFASVLALSPEAVAVVLAVKGLGRYPELRHPGAAERFIIGTLTSLLWSAGAAGVAVLAL